MEPRILRPPPWIELSLACSTGTLIMVMNGFLNDPEKHAQDRSWRIMGDLILSHRISLQHWAIECRTSHWVENLCFLSLSCTHQFYR